MPRIGFKVNRMIAKLRREGVIKIRRDKWKRSITRKQRRDYAKNYRARHPEYVQRERDASLVRYWTISRGTERQRAVWRKAQRKRRKHLRACRNKHGRLALNLRIRFLVRWVAIQRRMAKALGHTDILMPESEP